MVNIQERFDLKQTVNLDDEAATMALGAQVANLIERGVIFLHGDLGAGKTTFVKGMLRAMGFDGSIKSPTYTLVEPYEVNGRRIFHFDLYRLADPEELEFIGMDDYLADEQALLLIEWPEKGAGWLKSCDVDVYLRYRGEARAAKIEAKARLS